MHILPPNLDIFNKFNNNKKGKSADKKDFSSKNENHEPENKKADPEKTGPAHNPIWKTSGSPRRRLPPGCEFTDDAIQNLFK